MKDRFDLEADIMALWHTADDIKVIWESIYDSQINWTTDRIANVLLGLEELVNARADRCFNTFEQVYQLNQHAPEDVKELRKKVASTLCGTEECPYKSKEKEDE